MIDDNLPTEKVEEIDYETHVCSGHDATGRPRYEINAHARSCPAAAPSGRCDCGLKYRISLSTEKTMHAAWRKRAEEAEASHAAQARRIEDLEAARMPDTLLSQGELETLVDVLQHHRLAALHGVILNKLFNLRPAIQSTKENGNACVHDRLDEDGCCRQCGVSRRGIGNA